MTQKRPQDTSTTQIETTPTSAPTPPPWFPHALVILRAVRVSALWGALCDSMKVARGRAGRSVALDFVLLLLTFALSDAAHLKEWFAQLAPIAAVLPAVWDRTALPSRSALSRFLRAITPVHVITLGTLLLDDLIEASLPIEQAGGLYDRDGQRTLVFDDDGTYHGARQRELADDATRPPPARRAQDLCARGYYGGSGRADVRRTRTVLQQAHTSEWLGCWSAPGNGHPFAQLEPACAAVVRYLSARGLVAAQGLLRLHGLYGYARIAAAITRHGLGYLMRCADYRLLRRKAVQEVIATPPHATYASADSSVRREAWQVLGVPWASAKNAADTVVTRLIVTRRRAHEPGRPRVGKRVGDWVYELFVTDRSATGWSIEDVLSLYFARGGFEGTLAQEDRERDLDRTLSWSPAGQSFWTLLGQLAWNLQLRMGLRLLPTPLRHTLWAPAVAATPSQSADAVPMETIAPPQDTAPAEAAPAEAAPAQSTTPAERTVTPPPTVARGRIAAAVGRATGRFGGSDFVWTEEGHLRCPEGKLLRRAETRCEPLRLRVLYRASPADCGVCAKWAQCRGRPTRTDRARYVTVLEPLPGTAVDPPAPVGPTDSPAAPASESTLAAIEKPVPPSSNAPQLGANAVWWVDVEASRARQRLREQLRGQQVVIAPPLRVVSPPAVPFVTRDERAHRRQTWQTQFTHNQRSPDSFGDALFGIHFRRSGVIHPVLHGGGSAAVWRRDRDPVERRAVG